MATRHPHHLRLATLPATGPDVFKQAAASPNLAVTSLTSDDRLWRKLAEVQQRIDALLNQLLPLPSSPRQPLIEAMRYGVIGSGKRLRALLTTEIGRVVGAEEDHTLRVAAAIECVHAQSLIHDDLPCMDDDDWRRGKPTVHRAFDEAIAVLAGDTLLAFAFEILADPATHPDGNVRSALVVALARAVGSGGLAGGQMMDLYPDGMADLPAGACEAHKTGALIRYCAEGGALLAGTAPRERTILIGFAERLGIAFQIRDDLLDLDGDPGCVGKALRKDAAAGRSSLVSRLGAHAGRAYAERLSAEAIALLDGLDAPTSMLRDIAQFAVERSV